ncbi:MAG: class I SAM-dependent methyltransferase [Planctomycetes bacterium]|nr:class I SAM-dependent methyltransferase [Planctomycetota bacterium]
MISNRLFRAYYPDERKDGNVLFYGWLRQHVHRGSTVLNLGAGPPTRNPIRILKGEVSRVVGADIDPAVLHNPELDEAHVVRDGRLPFENNVFDTVFSDYVLEHVEQPDSFLREVHRVLKPGSAYLFRTPNLFHYVSLISRLTPEAFHHWIANRARGLPADAHEPWPTFYRMNTVPRLRTLGRRTGFRGSEFRMVEAQPSYLMFHRLPFLLGVAYERLVNRCAGLAVLRANILGRLVK